ncbi:MAG: hypothetical protein A2491_19250 [Bacteroidetes bacterium RIFOXYC12_FULL_35_7]|nr:MAG: hypothetical protein A2491_19250 [Bacteroidetes bacterium RIFOXYC12_FULL_35_7]
MLATIAAPAAAGTQTFPAFSQAVGTATNYFWITMDVGSATVAGHILAVNGTLVANVTANLVPTGSTSTASGNQTMLAPVAIADADVINGNGYVCTNLSGVAFSCPVITGASSYVWTMSTDATIATGDGTNSITVDFGAAATQGFIYVAGSNGTCTGKSSSVAIYLMDAPVITTQPTATYYGCNSTSLTFSVVATGAGLTYEWQRNTVAVSGGVYSGETTENLIISDPAGLSGSVYRCVIDGPCGSIISDNATLTVLASGMSGSYTVGAAGNYARLELAFTDINNRGLTGNVQLEIISDITETATASLNQWTNCGNTGYTVTIYPTGSARTISGAITTSLITLNGADNVTIDGSLGGGGTDTSLTISNTDLTFAGSTIKFINDACYNTIKYCRIKGTENSTTNGVVFFSTATATGNNNNTITSCQIRDGATNPVVCIYALGTVGMENSNNTISNCWIYNFWKTSSVSYGMKIYGGNTKWTISGNSIFQKAARQNCDFYGIVVNNANGQEFVVENNKIGGQDPDCGGAALTYSYTVYNPYFYGIFLTTSTSGISYIQNNTIKNLNITTVAIAAPDVCIVPIAASTGRIDVTGNTIGDNGAGTSIIITMNANGGNYPINIGIYKTGDGNILNNSVGSITFNGTITVTNVFYGYFISGTVTTDVLVSGNTIGSTSQVNSIQTLAHATNSPVKFIGFIFGTAGNYITTVSNNTVANITMSGTGVLPMFRGINNQATGGTQNLINNTVFNISNASSNTSESITGIINFNGNTTISQNTIHSLSAIGAAQVVAEGIYNQGTASANVISSNFIHSFTTTQAGAYQRGINLSAGPSTVSNNMIRLGINASGGSINAATFIYGLYKATTANTNFYFNSVYIGGNNTGVAAATYAFRRLAAGTDISKNNIYYNARTGLGNHFAIVIEATTTFTSDYNDLFSAAAGTLGSVNGGGAALTFANWKIAILAPKDAASISLDPSFITPLGTSATVNLHINDASPCKGVGWFGSNILIDYDFQTRQTGVSPNGPSIGADELFTIALGNDAYGIYSPEELDGTVSNCEIYATGGTPGGLGIKVAKPTDAFYTNVGISGYQIITTENKSCTNNNINLTTTDGTPDWLLGNGSNPASGAISPITTQFSSTGRKDILESVKVFKDFVNITMVAPSAGSILGAPVGAGCPTTYSYSSSVAGSAGFTYYWTAVTPGGCQALIADNDASTTDITFVNTTGVNQVFTLKLDITTECCGPLPQVIRYITIWPGPLAPVIDGGPFSVCTGGEQSFSVDIPDPDPGYAYGWYSLSAGGTFYGAGSSYTVTTALSGANSYWAQATNSFGCNSARTAAVVTGIDEPAPTVVNSSTCGAADVTLTVTAPGAGYTYVWYSGSCGGTELQSSTAISYTSNITADVTYYVRAIPPGCGPGLCASPFINYTEPPNPVSWLGNNTDWFNTANWTSGCVPSCGVNIEIPNLGNDPDIGYNAAAHASCQDILLESGAILSFSDSRAELGVCGNFTHTGILTTNNLGKVTFEGSAPQAYTRIGTGDFNNVGVANSNGLTLNNNLSIGTVGTLSLNTGTITTGGNYLIVKNMATDAINAYSATSYINGNLSRYVATGSYDFPVGNANAYELANIDLINNTSIGNLTVNFGNPENATGTGLPLPETFGDYDAVLNCGGVDATTGNANGGVWTITPDAGSSTNCDITLYGRNFDNAGTVGHTVLKRTTAGPGAWELNGTAATAVLASNVVSTSRTGMTGFSQFAIGRRNNGATLPIYLSQFSVSCSDNFAHLIWSTASEINNDYFILERSFDSENWELVAEIKGVGNSSSIENYEYIDKQTTFLQIYYRLSQVDYNGKKTVFNIVTTNCLNNSNHQAGRLILFPNPACDYLSLVFSDVAEKTGKIEILDELGKKVFEKVIATDNDWSKIQIDISGLAQGQYYLKTLFERESLPVQKFVVNRGW